MKTLKFEYDGQPFRVYLDRDGAVFIDVKDVAGDELVKEYLEDHPACKLIDKRPVWTESVFYHAWMDDMAPDRFMFFYLEEVQPRIRESLMCMAEKSEKAEKSLSEYGKNYEILLEHFTRICAINGIMSRLLYELSKTSKDKKVLVRIADVLNRGLPHGKI